MAHLTKIGIENNDLCRLAATQSSGNLPHKFCEGVTINRNFEEVHIVADLVDVISSIPIIVTNELKSKINTQNSIIMSERKANQHHRMPMT